MIKLTAWNAEWLDTYWGVVNGTYAPGQNLFPHDAPSKSDAKARIAASQAFIEKLDADILFLCEAPKGEEEMRAFVKEVTPGYHLVTRDAGDSYFTEGRQWQWFLVRDSLAQQVEPQLVPVKTWRDFAALSDPAISENGQWKIAVPKLKTVGSVKNVPVASRVKHEFYREPQILKFSFGGTHHEIIGAHLKSKHVHGKPRNRKADETFDEYLASSKKVREYIAKSHEARVKLSSEALAIRAYIDQRFAQEADPSIFVVGDLNDGPGKELMEREYLMHDLVSNLQGDVFFARQFLNHALFDQPDSLRWTAQFSDSLDPSRDRNILLDHIMFTQALTRSGTSPLVVKPNAGRVEHLLFEECESQFGKGMLSDHRPVSVELSAR